MASVGVDVGRTDLRGSLSLSLAIPLGIALVVAFPVWVALQPGPGAHTTVYDVQILLACYCGIRLTMMALALERRLIQGVFWLFCYIAMGIAPLAQDVMGQTPTPFVGTERTMLDAVMLTLGGCLAFDVGVYFSRFSPVRPESLARGRVFTRFGTGLLVLMAVGGSGLLIAKLGVSTFFSSRQDVTAALDGGASAITASSGSQVGSAFLRGFGTVPALMALLVVIRQCANLRGRPPARMLVLLVGLGLINLVVNNPISNPRYWALTVIFAIVTVAMPRSIAVYRVILIGGVLGALLVFPFADKFRYNSSAGGYHPVQHNSALDPLVEKDYDQMVMFGNAVTYVDSGLGHTHGRQTSSAVLFFVPRSAWSGKAPDTGVLLGTWMGLNNNNVSAPLWTELWLDFGAAGMIPGFILLGWFSGRADRRYAARSVVLPVSERAASARLLERLPIATIVVPLTAGYGFILLRGSLLQAMGRIGVLVVCLALTTARPRRQAAE